MPPARKRRLGPWTRLSARRAVRQGSTLVPRLCASLAPSRRVYNKPYAPFGQVLRRRERSHITSLPSTRSLTTHVPLSGVFRAAILNTSAMDRPICHFEALRRQLLSLLPLDSLRTHYLDRLEIVAAVRWHESVYGHRAAQVNLSRRQVWASSVRRQHTDLTPGQLLTCSIIPESISALSGCVPDQSHY